MTERLLLQRPTSDRPTGYQFVWWWRWRSLWKPVNLQFLPYPDHGPVCPATGAVYRWMGLRLGPLEIRKWGTTTGACTCA
jgi:hypothetical protein